MSVNDIPKLHHEVELKESNSSDEEGWIELEEDNTIVKCLFCSNLYKDANAFNNAIQHLKVEHGFDLDILKSKFSMDQYSFIKMINYIRKHGATPDPFMHCDNAFWEDGQYLKPIEYESWLMFDFEEIDNSKNSITQSEKQQIRELLQQIKEKDDLLEQAAKDILNLKISFRTMFEKHVDDEIAVKPLEYKSRCVASIPNHQDEGYFFTYAHYEIHHDMLNDKIRTDSFRNAIINNTGVIKDKVIMDLGCGTAILSMFASQAGAKKIIAVDQSEIIYQAMDIVRQNKIPNIEFVKGRIEDTNIPDDKVDIIISEWMGYFLLFEGMLDSVIYARDHHLNPDGLLIPNRCTMSLIGYGDESRHQNVVRFWEDVYGFDMSCLQKEVLREAAIEICNPNFILTNENIIADFNLLTVNIDCPNFSYNFNFNVILTGKLTSLVGYFDTFFELPNNYQFSTSPKSTPTHWKQVVFYIKTPIDVVEGATITGKFICRRDRKDVRALNIQIEMFGQTLHYNLN